MTTMGPEEELLSFAELSSFALPASGITIISTPTRTKAASRMKSAFLMYFQNPDFFKL